MEEPMNYRDLLQQLACLTVRTTIRSKIFGCKLIVFAVLSAFGFSVVARGATYYVSSEGKNDPMGPKTGKAHVIRGGGWNSFALACRCAARSSAPASYQYTHTGFRVVMEVTE